MINRRFRAYAWGVVGYNILVILWGAFVRATGSGAGCGAHWPLCNGEVIPRAPAVETMIEFAHRVTSGLALVSVVILLIWAMRAYAKGSPVRRAAALSVFFMVTESLLGAGLVLFEWVAKDASLGRVISMGLHLINTFLLLASMTMTAWFASGGARPRLKGQGAALWGIGIGLLGVIILGVTGAMTALGDTLFPAASLAEGLRQDLFAASHFLVRLRIWHPFLAILNGFYLVTLATLLALFRQTAAQKRAAWLLGGLFAAQLTAGLVNLILLVPVWMQIIHLLLADLVWIALILLSAVTLSENSTKDGL